VWLSGHERAQLHPRVTLWATRSYLSFIITSHVGQGSAFVGTLGVALYVYVYDCAPPLCATVHCACVRGQRILAAADLMLSVRVEPSAIIMHRKV
jgi:hypothetical protein